MPTFGFHFGDDECFARIEKLLVDLGRAFKTLDLDLKKEIRLMTSKLDTIGPKLDAMTTVGDGMEALLASLVTEIATLRTGDPEQDAKIDALNAKIEAKTAEWSAAVANVPVSAEPGPGPVPVE